jgi:osmotically-inducible protein OsmY
MKTDMQLVKDVQEELMWEPAVCATNIGVTAKDGVVTLTGHVASYTEKLTAEHAAQRVQGVKALAIEMDVQLNSGDMRTDTEIATAANRALEWNVAIPAGRVQVTVEKGHITLTGDVEWGYQREAAVRALRELRGVVGVFSQVSVKPHISPIDVQKSIEGALARQAEREAKHLKIQVNGSQVTLHGTVHSWAERHAAVGAAWSAPGVSTVVDDLEIAS